MFLIRSFYVVAVLTVGSLVAADDEGYGVDCSFPIHSTESSCGDLLGDRQAVYDEYMQGCRDHWGSKGAARCNANERDRIEMSRRQPQSMVVRFVTVLLLSRHGFTY
jgi:hypothetical protein